MPIVFFTKLMIYFGLWIFASVYMLDYHMTSV